MTPKEQASELTWKFYNRLEHTISDEYSHMDYEISKECALIATDELIKHSMLILKQSSIFQPELPALDLFTFWNKVKVEIEKL